MCGGFILAYSSAKIDSSSSFLNQSICHLFYNIGRISAYVLLGAFFGLLAQSMDFSRLFMGYIHFTIGIIMVLIGLSLIGKIRFLTAVESSFLFNKKFKKVFLQMTKSKSRLSFYILGFLNGLFPCGLVYFFIASAIASGSWVKGAFIMSVFGMSTLPAVFSVGIFVGLLKSSRFKNIMIKIASIMVIMQGIYLSFNGFLATQN